ncbi:hypothetical protein E2C01_070042 [Portunus trituberculatus]|uniref:Uncharacterized protein n=1 Tax=Portunus trituberculatus TaxID=210409 RepID=A0A5B7I174_PORTR|nr:hypothetical protein [Portunus trituberculatus]
MLSKGATGAAASWLGEGENNQELPLQSSSQWQGKTRSHIFTSLGPKDDGLPFTPAKLIPLYN